MIFTLRLMTDYEVEGAVNSKCEEAVKEDGSEQDINFNIDTTIQSINNLTGLVMDDPELDDEDAEGDWDDERNPDDYEEYSDGNFDDTIAEAIGRQLGDSLWADISHSHPQEATLQAFPEHELVSCILQILEYLPQDTKAEQSFSEYIISIGEEQFSILAIMKSIADTGEIDDDTAKALAGAVEKIAEGELFSTIELERDTKRVDEAFGYKP